MTDSKRMLQYVVDRDGLDAYEYLDWAPGPTELTPSERRFIKKINFNPPPKNKYKDEPKNPKDAPKKKTAVVVTKHKSSKKHQRVINVWDMWDKRTFTIDELLNGSVFMNNFWLVVRINFNGDPAKLIESKSPWAAVYAAHMLNTALYPITFPVDWKICYRYRAETWAAITTYVDLLFNRTYVTPDFKYYEFIQKYKDYVIQRMEHLGIIYKNEEQ